MCVKPIGLPLKRIGRKRDTPAGQPFIYIFPMNICAHLIQTSQTGQHLLTLVHSMSQAWQPVHFQFGQILFGQRQERGLRADFEKNKRAHFANGFYPIAEMHFTADMPGPIGIACDALFFQLTCQRGYQRNLGPGVSYTLNCVFPFGCCWLHQGRVIGAGS